MNPRLPLIVILGATGCGKTKLSLELARKFGGEVIGADAMQMYKGLDIVTAKATKDEQSIVPHHLIDILEPHEIFTVFEYRNKALQIIDNLFSKNKLPIIVGGTNYYIEALLWKILIENAVQHNPVPGVLPNNDHELPSKELHEKLMQLDPAMARRLHPNNKRKILRSLEVFYQNGRKHSELLSEQHNSKGGSQTCGGLRYPNSVILRLQCEKDILDERLNNRVDAMLGQGLLDELNTFHSQHNQKEIPDYTKGIFQSIGFKEFDSYLRLDEDERGTVNGQKIFQQSLDEMKMVTRRYARKQEKWTNNRFLGRLDREVPPMFGLDTTNVDQWSINVSVPAMEIVDSFVNGTDCKYQQLERLEQVQQEQEQQQVKTTANAEDDTYVCDVCERVFIGSYQWTIHRKSHRHKRMVERKNRLVKEQCF